MLQAAKVLAIIGSMGNDFRTLGLAIQHHQAGRLQLAEQIYRSILAVEPNHPGALHLLGIIAHQMGRQEVAVESIGQAIALRRLMPPSITTSA